MRRQKIPEFRDFYDRVDCLAHNFDMEPLKFVRFKIRQMKYSRIVNGNPDEGLYTQNLCRINVPYPAGPC